MKLFTGLIACAALLLTSVSAFAQAPAPPVITKSFGAAAMPLNATTTLTFTITNTEVLFGVGFTDTLPASLIVASPNGLNGSCGLGGTITAIAGTHSIALSGALMRANSLCTFSVNVTGIAPGAQNNTVTVSDAPSGVVGNTANALIVVGQGLPPVLAKSFGAPNINVNAITTLTFTLTNPNPAIPLTGLSFNDPLPAGLAVAVGGVVNNCGGTVAAVVGSQMISLTGGALGPGASCAVTVTVGGIAAGLQTNTTGPVASLEGGSGLPATATITVLPVIVQGMPPQLGKSFGAPVIVINGTATLTFTLTNPNALTVLTGVGFKDPLPPGLVVATPNGLANGCGGTVTAPEAATNISLAGVTLVAGTMCTLMVNVTALNIGVINNTTDPVTSDNGGIGSAATATLTVQQVFPALVAPDLDAYQVRYMSNLNIGFSVINFTNTGTLTLPSGLEATGNICVNLYGFDANEELVSCCSCLVTPNGLNSLSSSDFLSGTLNLGDPTSMIIKLLATTPIGMSSTGTGGFCNASSPTSTPAGPGVAGSLVPGLRAWATTLHALPTAPVTYALTETEFLPAPLSQAELTKLTLFCNFIQANGSGFGFCKSCREGGR